MPEDNNHYSVSQPKRGRSLSSDQRKTDDFVNPFALSSTAFNKFPIKQPSSLIKINHLQRNITEKSSEKNHAPFQLAKEEPSDKNIPFYKNIEQRVTKKALPLVFELLYSSAILFSNKGNYTEAFELYEELLEIQKKLKEAKHPNSARILVRMADIFKFKSEYQKALGLYEKAIEMYKDKDNSPHYLIALIKKEEVNIDLRNFEKSEDLITQCMDKLIKKVEKGNPVILKGKQVLANLYREIGRFDEAKKLYKEALHAHLKAAEKRPHAAVAEIYRELYQLACKQRIEEGTLQKSEEKYLEKARTIYRSIGGEEHPRLVQLTAL